MSDTPFADGARPSREKFRTFLESHGYRKTPERFALLDKAMSLPGHFGVDELYEAMESDGYHVSKATVNSTLKLLCDCGLLNRHQFGGRKGRYEVAEDNHLHLICRKCGRIREVDNLDVDAMLSHLDLGGFVPAYCSTLVYGVCGDCLSRQTDEPAAAMHNRQPNRQINN